MAKNEHIFVESAGSAIVEGLKKGLFEADSEKIKERLLQGGLEAVQTYIIELVVRAGTKFLVKIFTEEEFREKALVGAFVIASAPFLVAFGLASLLPGQEPMEEWERYDPLHDGPYGGYPL